MYQDLALHVRNKALELGYEKCGIILISDMYDYADKLKQRIELIPEARPYMERFYRFANLQNDYSWARSIVV